MEAELSIEKIKILLFSTDESTHELGKTLDQSLFGGLIIAEILEKIELGFGKRFSLNELMSNSSIHLIYHFRSEYKLSASIRLLKNSAHLKTLRARYTHHQLPEDIGALQVLENLNLSHSKKTRSSYKRFEFLPTSIGNLNFLRTLDLKNNNLSYLPETIGQLEQLETLDFYDNNLQELPTTLGHLKSLLTLNLKRNSLSYLPNNFGCLKHLKSLDASYNTLEWLPSNFHLLENLEHLKLNNNRINRLPQNFGKLKKLQHLDLSYNRILPFPREILKLKKLRSLNIKKNPFATRWVNKIKAALPHCRLIV